MDNLISLPPLPEALIESYQIDGTMRRTTMHTYDAVDMREYAHKAIEHMLTTSGQYLTNDASRDAALNDAYADGRKDEREEARMVNSYRDLKVAEADGMRHDAEVRTSVGFLLALRKSREVSLRDEFAAAAIMKLSTDWQPESAARLAYQLADAMLKEREA